MWIHEVFGRRSIILGMVHLDALPGTPLFDETGGLEQVIRHAQEDYLNLIRGGISGVIFCNENDKPYSKNVGKETVAAMTAVVNRVTGGQPAVPFGIDVQWDPKAALAVALVTGASFIRGIVCGTYCGDLGFFVPDAEEIIRYRHGIGADHVRVLTNITPEFSHRVDLRPIELIARSAVNSSLVDGICVSGVMAGSQASYSELMAVKKAVPEVPVIANTGVNASNVREMLSIADACVAATCFKAGQNPRGRIDVNNVRKLTLQFEKQLCEMQAGR